MMKVIEKDKISVEFGAFIREAREAKGLYQADVAEMIGVSRSYYAFIEGGQRDIYLTLAVNLCRVLDLDINDFMTRLK
jgi:transcriptional regulator with XRE-family HTH domain